ncbi:MAG TPA: beta-propeller fold lactonase family protein [Stellaceae bacterium]|nr:beta-propeller fold lactonase family protein [Stellaceae bacterium]
MAGLRLAGRAAAAAAALLLAASGVASAQLLIVGNDQKPGWDANLKPVPHEPGHDTLSVIDISKPAAPRIAATIPLENTIAGPPTNLAIAPSRDIALVANSLMPQGGGTEYKMVPDDKVFVIDLKANPPAVISTITAGKQPSGMAISRDGRLALVCNRAAGTLTVLSIDGKDVKAVDTVTVGAAGDQVSAVAITPDGKHALVLKSKANLVALLAIDNGKVTYDKHDLPAGIYPYNVAVTPNGQIALVADTGNGGSSDGNVDTVSVIDLTANPPRVVDHITVGDSPEGLAISPKGNLAVTVEARGSNRPKDTWYYHPTGAVTVLQIAGKRVRRVGEVQVGALPEGAAFSADGGYLYVGNFIDKNLSVLKVSGDTLRSAATFKLPGQPASLRSGPQ